MNDNTNNIEEKIIEAARSLFIEKGFAETSMSEIATRAGINRSGLHYYFRTKDKMYDAVFGMTIQSILPKVQDILSKRDMPVAERIGSVVDTYYDVLRKNPSLPLFIMREIHRDIDHMLDTIHNSLMRDAVMNLKSELLEEMAEGRLRRVPLKFLFFTFYGLLTFPFLTKNFSERLLNDCLGQRESMSFEETLTQWKPYIISQMEHLLEVK